MGAALAMPFRVKSKAIGDGSAAGCDWELRYAIPTANVACNIAGNSAGFCFDAFEGVSPWQPF
jgi:hypothetical protein